MGMRAVMATVALLSGFGAAVVGLPLAHRALVASRAAEKPAEAQAMTELKVRDVVPLSSVHQAAVILAPDAGDLIVPVLVSEDEGELLADQLHGHGAEGSVLRKTIDGLGGKLVRVELPGLKGESVEARVVVESHGRSVTIEGSPADSIGLALESHVPVMASKAVLEGLGLTRAQIRALVRGRPGSSGEHELTPGSNNSISL